MKAIITTILFIVLTNSNLQAQAHLYRDSILAVMPNYITSMKRIDSLAKAYRTQIKTGMVKLNEKRMVLIKPYNPVENETLETIQKRMKAEDIAALQLITKEQDLIDKESKVLEGSVTNIYNSTIQPILNKVNTAISNYAKEKKIDYVWIMEEVSNGLAYINTGKNITQQIIATVKSN